MAKIWYNLWHWPAQPGEAPAGALVAAVMHEAMDGVMPCASCFCNLYLILSFVFVDVLFPFSIRVTLNPRGEIQALSFHIMKLCIISLMNPCNTLQIKYYLLSLL